LKNTVAPSCSSPAVEQADHHERKFDDKFENKAEYGREENDRQLEGREVSPRADDLIPDLAHAGFHNGFVALSCSLHITTDYFHTPPEIFMQLPLEFVFGA